VTAYVCSSVGCSSDQAPIKRVFSDTERATELLNDLKNQSLYVSLIDDTFLKPVERIDPHVAQATISRAHSHLQHVHTIYAEWSTLTGMTEEGIQKALASPEFQVASQMLELETDVFD
jgi:hypothetical protein